jgi:hypothetical protein
MTGWRRRAAEYGGALLAAAGILAALNRVLGGGVDPVAAFLLAGAGASILLSVARAWRLPSRLRRSPLPRRVSCTTAEPSLTTAVVREVP